MKPEYLRVKDHPELIRDTKSNAVLNTDVQALNKYKEERDFKLKLAKIVQEHDEVKQDLSDIKSMLSELLKQR